MAQAPKTRTERKINLNFDAIGQNKLSDFLFQLSIKSSSGIDKKQLALRLGIPEKTLDNLFSQLKDNFSLALNENEKLTDFFLRASSFLEQNLAATAESLGEDITGNSVPANMGSLVAALSKREQELTEVREKIASKLSKYQTGPSRTDQIINRLIEQQTRQIQASLKEQDILITPGKAQEAAIKAITSASPQKAEAVLTNLNIPFQTASQAIEQAANQQDLDLSSAVASSKISQIVGQTAETEKIVKQTIQAQTKHVIKTFSSQNISIDSNEAKNIATELINGRNKSVVEKVNPLPASQKLTIEQAFKPVPGTPLPIKPKQQTAVIYSKAQQTISGLLDQRRTSQKQIANQAILNQAKLISQITGLGHEECLLLATESIATPQAFDISLAKLPITDEQKQGLISVDPRFLATQAALTEDIRPVLASAIGQTATEELDELSSQVATIMMAEQNQPGVLNENQIATKTGLILASKRIKLQQSLPIKKLSISGAQNLRVDSKQSQKAKWLENLGLTSAIEQYLANRGFDVTDQSVKQGIEGANDLINFQENNQSQIAINTTIPADGRIGNQTFESPITAIAIPTNPEEVWNNFFSSTQPQSGLNLIMRTLNTPSDQVAQTQKKLKMFFQSIKRESAFQDPFLANIYDQFHIIEDIRNNPLYQVASPAVDWFNQKFIKGRIVTWLGKTAIGKGVKKASEKAIAWGVQQVGKKIGKQILIEGGKALTKKGLTAALATALGIPTGGATILIWLGTEIALKLGGKLKNLLGKMKISNIISGLAADLGLNINIGFKPGDKLKELLPIIPEFVASFINQISNIAIPVTGLITTAFLIAFGLLFWSNKNMMKMVSTLTVGGGRGAAPSYRDSNAIDIVINEEECLAFSNNAQKACLTSIIFQACPIDSVNRNSISQFVGCVNSSSLGNYFSSSEIQDMINRIRESVNRYDHLQCVGFKRGMEPSLPIAGDAINFANKNRILPCYPILNTEVREGDNAVWTWAPDGHIGIVLSVDNENELATIAQAWGNNGRIGTTRVPIVSVHQYIRCD